VFRFAKPDGTFYETSWQGVGADSTARAWADYFGHKLLGEIPSERAETGPSSLPVRDQRAEANLSPPPLVQAASPIKLKPGKKPPTPVESTQPKVLPPDSVRENRYVPKPYKYKPDPLWDRITQYMKDDFIDTTATKSLPLISTWYRRFGKVLEYIPPLKGVGKGFEAVADIADGLQLLYELIHEVNQAEALEKGSKQVVKTVKPVKRIAEALIKKKYPNLSEPVRKKVAEILEELFEKYGSDPAIEKGKKKAQELDEDKDLDRSLYEKLKKTLSAAPVLR
jgi:hypothetical protein